MFEVTTINPDRSLLTTAELRAAAGVSDGSKDAVLVPLGNYVAAMITKTACRVTADGVTPPTLRLEAVQDTFRSTYSRSRRHYYSGNHRALYLSRKPIVAVTSVTENDAVLVAGTDYLVNKATGSITRMLSDREVCWAYGTIAVPYSAGWDTVPDDLKFAATRYVELMLNQADDPLLRRKSIPGVIEKEWWIEPSRQVGVPPEIMDMLEVGGYANEVAV